MVLLWVMVIQLSVQFACLNLRMEMRPESCLAATFFIWLASTNGWNINKLLVPYAGHLWCRKTEQWVTGPGNRNFQMILYSGVHPIMSLAIMACGRKACSAMASVNSCWKINTGSWKGLLLRYVVYIAGMLISNKGVKKVFQCWSHEEGKEIIKIYLRWLDEINKGCIGWEIPALVRKNSVSCLLSNHYKNLALNLGSSHGRARPSCEDGWLPLCHHRLFGENNLISLIKVFYTGMYSQVVKVGYQISQ